MVSKLPQPNYTQIPNMLLDSMSSMEDSELRILLAAARLIIGWHKTGPEPISLTQFRKLTGMSNKGVRTGIELAIRREWLVISDKKGKRGTNCYVLSFSDYAPEEHSQPPDYAPGEHSQKSDYILEEHSQPPDYAPEEHSTMCLRNNTKESTPKKERLKKRKDSTAPNGAVIGISNPIETFIENELSFEEPAAEEQTPPETTERAYFEKAVQSYFDLKAPTKSSGYGYMNKLINFFTGKIKPNPKKAAHDQDKWYQNQFDENPLTPFEIIGLAVWWEDICDYDLPTTPGTIAEKVPLFRLSKKYDEHIDKAKRYLDEKIALDKPKPKKELAPPEQVAAFKAQIAAITKGLK